MRRILLMLILAAGCFTAVGCQGSGEVARAWAVRAERGLQIERENTEALLAALGEAKKAARKAELAALMRGLKASVDDGKPDYEGFTTRMAGHIQAQMDDRDALRDARATAAVNRAEVRKALDGMVKAASAWGMQDEIKGRLDRIESLVVGMLERGAK